MLYKEASSYLLKDFKLLSFVAAILLYAICGSPTPDFPGVTELLIAIFLLLSIGGLAGVVQVFSFYKEKRPLFLLPSLTLLLYGLFIPSIQALIYNYDAIAVLRDLVGFIFLCLPIFFFQFFYGKINRCNVFLCVILVLSIIFSARVLYATQTIELLYLANSPIVMFSLFFMPFWAAKKLYMQFTLRNVLQMLVCWVVSSFILFAVLQDVQRAPVFALSVSAVFLFIVAVCYSPRRTLYLLPFFLVPVFFMLPYLQSVVDDLLQKTVRVGVNMRFQELEAIWGSISQNPWTVLFGSGWGGSYASPAVGNLYVTYSHSLLSYILFKMGIVGLTITAIYVFFLLKAIFNVVRRDVVLGNALFWAAIIPIFLYASHKSFDFGLLLTLIFVSYQNSRIKTDEAKLQNRARNQVI